MSSYKAGKDGEWPGPDHLPGCGENGWEGGSDRSGG